MEPGGRPSFLAGLACGAACCIPERSVSAEKRESVCVCVVVVVVGGTEDSPKVGDGVSLSCPPSPISSCRTSSHTHTIMSLATACLAQSGSLQDMKFCYLYGKPYISTVFHTVVGQGRSPGLRLGNLNPIFSESDPLPEHNAYITFDFMPYRFAWTDFYGPWSNSVRKTVLLYGLPYFTIFSPPALVPRPW